MTTALQFILEPANGKNLEKNLKTVSKKPLSFAVKLI